MTKQLGALILLACLGGPTSSQAQSYPTRPITLTVTAAAGGVTDVVARAIGQRLSETWGQEVVNQHKGGGAGGGQSGPRRLLAAGGGGRRLHRQSDPLRQGQAALRRGEGLRSDHRH